MEFIDPRDYLKDNRLYEYMIMLHNEYFALAHEMYQKFIDKLQFPKCNFIVMDIGNISGNGLCVMNGQFVPPNMIRINLLNVALSAHDNGIKLHRTDFDTLMKAELAYCIIHEISHSTQNTFVPSHLVPAMEYANNARVYNELIPKLELVLKRTYKINLYTDRVDAYTERVFSYQYQHIDPAHRLINFLVYNAFNDDDEPTRTGFLKDAEKSSNIVVNFTAYGRVQFNGYIKKDNVYNQRDSIEFLSHFPPIPPSIDIYGEFDVVDDTAYITVTITRGEYCPIVFPTD